MATQKNFERDFAIFVDDLGGLVWSIKQAEHATWKELGAETNCDGKTLKRLADRTTKNPTLYTCWKVLRGLDNASVIRHSQLERYRGIAPPKAKPKPPLKVVA
jgi:hypothetical protein